MIGLIFMWAYICAVWGLVCWCVWSIEANKTRELAILFLCAPLAPVMIPLVGLYFLITLVRPTYSCVKELLKVAWKGNN